ncbi:MAG: hypothetical protein R3A45_06690 [Bdellovibrionota bacterium]
MRKINVFWSLYVLLVLVVLAGCGGERQNVGPLTSLPEIIFEEIHPENTGRLSPKVIEWQKWTWHQSLKTGDFLQLGVHFSFPSGALPKGLTLAIEVTGQRSGLVQFLGQAKDHHVNDSLRGLILTFHKEAFLEASPNALKYEQYQWSVGIQFGKGYTISGVVEGATGTIVLREMDKDQTVTIGSKDPSFIFEKLYEEDEPYLIQIEKHPAGQCCKFIEAEGQFGKNNIDHLYLSCNQPEWHHPVDETDIFTINGFDPVAPDFTSTKSFDSNAYGDFIFGYEHDLQVQAFEVCSHPGSTKTPKPGPTPKATPHQMT